VRSRLPGLVLVFIAVIYGQQALQIPVLPADAQEAMNARTLPMVLTGVLLLISLALMLPGRRHVSLATTLTTQARHWWQALGLLGVCVLFAFTIDPLGVLVSSALAILAGLLVLAVRRRVVLVFVPLLVGAFLWLLLSAMLGLYLHPGDVWAGHA